MCNVAKEVILPSENFVFRTVFLYVGQGDATLMVIPTIAGQKQFLLIDSNIDEANGGIDLPRLLKDLLDEGAQLDTFVNTHPHNDHIRGVKSIYDEVGIGEVWHSGHVPGQDHSDGFDELKFVIDAVGSESTFELRGTRSENTLDHNGKPEVHAIGVVTYNVLSPAEHIKDDIADEKPEQRYQRIHEHCGVLRFFYGDPAVPIMITGDSDKRAWKDNKITEYHHERITSKVLSASHHGSRTFFKENENDEDPYKEHMEIINPTYTIVSAPKPSESKHGHPHDDAMAIYREYVDDDCLIHLGNKRECVIVDIYPNGDLEVNLDWKLVDEYGYKPSNDDDENKKSSRISTPYVGIPITKLDDKPMGNP